MPAGQLPFASEKQAFLWEKRPIEKHLFDLHRMLNG